MALLVAAGVTSVRDCGGDFETLQRWRREIAEGRRIGPIIYLSGPAVDGPKEDAKFRLTIATPDEAKRAVDSLAQMGVNFIKTHNAIPRDAYFAVLVEARRHNLRVASHLPKGVPAWEAADAGVGSIEHAAESLLASPIYAGYAADVEEAMAWWESAQGDAAIDHLARARVAVTPTLVTYAAFTEMRRGTPSYEPRQRVLAFLLKLTGRLYRAGVVILAGSDFASAEVPLVPGKSLLDEVALLEQAGLPRDEALKAAGSNIAEWLQPTN
ncbi:MAG: amidohydrolase family protein [Burkholderiales bacterium]